MPDPTYFAGTQGRVVTGDAEAVPPTDKDWGVTSWDCSIKANSASVTTTKCYDPTTKRTWTKRIVTTHEASGTFEFLYDKDQPPFASIVAGVTIDAEFVINDVDSVTGPIFIDSVDVKSGGMEGVGGASVKWTSNGAMILPNDVPPV